MDVAQWMEPGFDAIRAKRLGVGFVLGAVILVGTVAFIASATPAPSETEEESVDVVFGDVPEEEEEVVAEEEEPEPEPETEPPPMDPTAPPMPVRAGPPPVPIDEVPTAVPTTEAAETDAPPNLGPAKGDPNANPGYGGDSPYGGPPATPIPKPEPAPEPKPAPKPRAKPKPKNKPVRVTEGMTPPQRVSGGHPSYPEAAKSQGIEGTVVVVYVVTETGAVTGVRAVRGPAALQGVCVAAVSSWRFTPAKDANGNPVSARRIAKFPFSIKTK